MINKNLQTKTRAVIASTILVFLMFFFGIQKTEAQTSYFNRNSDINSLSSFSKTVSDISATSSTNSTSSASSTSNLFNLNKINAPEIFAKNAVIYDITNKEFIYAKNAEEPVPMASLVKVITATVFLQLNNERQKRGNPVDTIKIFKQGAGFNQGDRDLINGEFWKVKNLIRYMLITSSNFAAQSLSRSVIDDEFAFSILMNKTTRDLGFKSFSFKNVSGLPIPNPVYNLKNNSKNEAYGTSTPKEFASAYGSAKEIAILFTMLFNDIPFLGEASIIPEADFINWSGNTHTTKNVNSSLIQIPHIIAGKTGTTDESGGNLVIIIDVNQKKYAIAILGSTIEERYNDAIKLASSTEAYSRDLRL